MAFVEALLPTFVSWRCKKSPNLNAASVATERKWSRASAAESKPERAARLQGHKEHQQRQKARALARLDHLLDVVDDSQLRSLQSPTDAITSPCGTFDIDWEKLPPGCDPCGVSAKMAAGSLRGERKRESVRAMAWLLGSLFLPRINLPEPSQTRLVTVVDAGCGTGSLLLPLAAAFPNVRFVGVDTKSGSLDRLMARATSARLEDRVEAWHGTIEEYDSECDVVLSLHACGGASDAALRLASERNVPFAVSPCCIGKLRRGPASQWLSRLIRESVQAAPLHYNPAHGLGSSSSGSSSSGSSSSGSSSGSSGSGSSSDGGGGSGSDSGFDDQSSADEREAKLFALLAAWADSDGGIADSAHGELTAAALAATRRQRCKTLVEMDRLAAMGEWAVEEARGEEEGEEGAASAAVPGGRLLRITGDAMLSSGQTEVLVSRA